MASQPSGSSWMPEGASTFAADVDALIDFIFTMNVVATVVVAALLAYLVFAWRRRTSDQRATTEGKGSPALAAGWSIVLVGIGVGIVGWGFSGALDMSTPPEVALQIRGQAEKGTWSFVYADVDKPQSVIHVARGRSARLVLAAKDAPTEIAIPELRIKATVVPGRYTTLWFKANRAGDLDVRGNGGAVVGKLTAHEPDALSDLVAAGFDAGGGPSGEKLYTKKTCNACHSLDGTRLVGPTFKGLLGKTEELESGKTVTVDDAYLRKSLTDPAADVVKGFAPTMPKLDLTDKELDALVEFVKAQK